MNERQTDRQTEIMNQPFTTIVEYQRTDSNDTTHTHIIQIYAKHVSPGYQFIGMFRATKQKIAYS